MTKKKNKLKKNKLRPNKIKPNKLKPTKPSNKLLLNVLIVL